MSIDEYHVEYKTLKSFLENFSTQTSESLQHLYNFFHEIVNSQKNSFIDRFCWFVSFLLLSTFVTFAAIEINIFSFFRDTVLSWVKQSEKLLFLQLSLLLSLFSYTVCIFQWESMIVVKKEYHYPKKRFKLLNICYLHLPHILAPIHGLIIGHVIFSNSNKYYYTELIIAMFQSVSFLAILVNYKIFVQVTKCSLTCDSTFFSYFELPHSYVDIVMFFVTGLNVTCKESSFQSLYLVFNLFLIIFGTWKFIRSQVPYFTSSFGYLILNKISLDIVFFSLLGIVFSFLSVNVMLQISIATGLHLIIGAFVSIMRTSAFSIFVFGYDPKLFLDISTSKASKALTAVACLRNGVLSQHKYVATTRYINNLLKVQFSPSLIGEVLRLCAVSDSLDLEEIFVPVTPLSSNDIISIQFLVYQYNYLQKMITQEENDDIKAVCDKMRMESAKMKFFLDAFWTNDDYKQHTLTDLSVEMGRITSELRKLHDTYFFQPSVQELWKNYTVTVLNSESKVIKSNYTPLTHLISESNPIYSVYLNKKNRLNFTYVPSPATNIEVYLKKREDSIIRPYTIFLRISFTLLLLFFTAILIVTFIYLTWVSQQFNLMSNSLIMAESLSKNLLHFIDTQKEKDLSASNISELLGLTLEEATTYLSLLMPFTVINASKFLMKQPLIYSDEEVYMGDCSSLTLTSLLMYDFVEKKSVETILCYFLQINTTIYGILEYAKSTSSKLSDSSDNMFYISYRLYLAANFILTFLFLLLMLRERTLLNRITLTLKRVIVFRKNRYMRDENLIYRNTIISIGKWFVVEFFLFVFFYIFSLMCTTTYNKIELMMSQMTSVATIASSCELALSGYILLSTYDYTPSSSFNLSFYNEKVLKSIDETYFSGFVESFSSISSISEWTNLNDSLSTQILEFIQSLNNVEYDYYSYSIQLARYLYLNSIKTVSETTLPSMIDVSVMAFQELLLNIFYVYLVIICFILLIIYLSRLWRNNVILFVKCGITIFRNFIASNTDFSQIIQHMLENKTYDYIEEMPFPVFIVKHDSGVIITANNYLLSFLKTTQHQLVGQKASVFFDNFDQKNYVGLVDNKKFRLEKYSDGAERDLYIIRNISELEYIKLKYENLKSRVSPNIHLPYSGKFIYFFFANSCQTDHVLDMVQYYKVAEDLCPQVKRISASHSIYIGVVLDININRETARSILAMSMKLMEPYPDKSMNIVISGDGIILGLNRDKACTVVNGEISERVSDIIRSTPFGKIVYDHWILKLTGENIPGIVTLTSVQERIQ